TVRLWDAVTGKLVRGLKHPPGEGMRSRPLTFVQDGKTLASAANNQLFLWDVRTGKQLREWTLKLNMAEDMQIYPLTVSADGKTAASGEKDGVIRLWDMASGTPLHVLQGHEKSIWSFSFSPDSKTLASTAGYDDKFVRLWDVSTGKLLRTLEHPQGVRSVAF